MIRLRCAAELAALVVCRAVLAIAGRRVQRARWGRDVEAWACDVETASNRWRETT